MLQSYDPSYSYAGSDAGDGDGCCGAGGGKQSDWTYVGNGNGVYTPSAYDYVGQGAGSHVKQEFTRPYGQQVRRVWYCLGGCCCLVVLFLVIGVLVTPAPEETAPPAVAQAAPAKPAAAQGAMGQPAHQIFDCNAGFANWENGWTQAKKNWCCKEHHRGCPTPAPLPDCTQGQPHEWDDPKKLYCCNKEGIGCTTVAPGVAFDCEAGYANWAQAWSEPKKRWCCQHEYVGCPGPGGN